MGQGGLPELGNLRAIRQGVLLGWIGSSQITIGMISGLTDFLKGGENLSKAGL